MSIWNTKTLRVYWPHYTSADNSDTQVAEQKEM